MAFPSQKQESFFYAHVCAFEHFGGVPWRISYDNLSTAVRLMVEGKVRREQRQFVAFRSYYLFESHFCQPAASSEVQAELWETQFTRTKDIWQDAHL